MIEIQKLVKCQRQTRGRRRNGLLRTHEAAALKPACAPLMEHITAAIALHTEAGALAIDWRRAQKNSAQHSDGATEADRLVDLAVSGLYNALLAIAETWEPEFAALARDLLNRYFADGPAGYTALPYTDEHDQVNMLLTGLYGPKCADARDKLPTIVPYIDRLAALNRSYGALLVRPERLTHEMVREADEESYQAYLEVICRVLGLFPSNRPSDLSARTDLLAPLFEQLDDLRENQKRREGDDEDDEDDEGDDEEDDEDEGVDGADPADGAGKADGGDPTSSGAAAGSPPPGAAPK